MTRVLDDLITLLELEKIEDTIFRGQSQDLGFGAVFGGQVLGQALSAARQTVPDERTVHSFHAYFLRPGDPKRPIVYDVERTRDGGSFTTRRVKAIQRGKAILFMGASFQGTEPGFDHASTMPEVPSPDRLPSERELAERWQHLIPKPMRSLFVCQTPIEIRPVQVNDPADPQPMHPRRQVWLRANGHVPDDPRVHRYLLAYASDFNFLVTALQPHGKIFWDPTLQLASIDHAMWFHRPFRFDDWLLYDVDSPSAAAARGLVRGQLFTRDGLLVASTAQEGLMRERNP